MVKYKQLYIFYHNTVLGCLGRQVYGQIGIWKFS
jgi:hypothetical protein